MKKFAFALMVCGLVGIAAPRAFAQCFDSTGNHPCELGTASPSSGQYFGAPPIIQQTESGVPTNERTIPGIGQMPVAPPDSQMEATPSEGAPVAQTLGVRAPLLKWYAKYCPENTNDVRPCVEIAAMLRNEEESGGSSASSISLSPLDHGAQPPPTMKEGTYKVLSIVSSPEDGNYAWLIATQGDGTPKVYRVPYTSLPAKLNNAGPGTLENTIILKVTKTFTVVGNQ